MPITLGTGGKPSYEGGKFLKNPSLSGNRTGSVIDTLAPVRVRLFRGEEQRAVSWWVGSLLKCDRFGYLESTNVIIPHPRGSVEPKIKRGDKPLTSINPKPDFQQLTRIRKR